MQIEMHDIKAQIAGPYNPQQGIQISPIAINQTACIMYHLDNFHDVLIKQTEGIRVCEHQAGQGFIAFRFEGFQINVTPFIRG